MTGFTEESDVWENYSVYYGSEKIANPKFTVNTDGDLLITGFADEVSYTHTYTYYTSTTATAEKTYTHGNGVKENITLIAKNGDYLEIPVIACSRIFTQANFSKAEWEKWFKPAGGGAVISGYFALGEDINYATKIQGETWRFPTKEGTNQAITQWNDQVVHNFNLNGLNHTLKVNTGYGGLFGNLVTSGQDVIKACDIFNIVLDVTCTSTASGAFVFGNTANVRLTNAIIKLGTYTSTITNALPSLSKLWQYSRMENVVIECAKYQADGTTTWLDYSNKASTQGIIAWGTMSIVASQYDNVFVVGDKNVPLKANTKTNSAFTRFDDYAVVNGEGESKTGFYSTDGTVASRWEGANWKFAYDATNNTVGFKK